MDVVETAAAVVVVSDSVDTNVDTAVAAHIVVRGDNVTYLGK